MKKIILVTLTCLFAFGAMAQEKEHDKEKAKVTFKVPMDGQCCIDEIKEGLAFEKGLKGISCDFEHQTVEVTYRKDKTNVETLVKAFAGIGKKATIMSADKKVSSEHSGCKGHDHD